MPLFEEEDFELLILELSFDLGLDLELDDDVDDDPEEEAEEAEEEPPPLICCASLSIMASMSAVGVLKVGFLNRRRGKMYVGGYY